MPRISFVLKKDLNSETLNSQFCENNDDFWDDSALISAYDAAIGDIKNGVNCGESKKLIMFITMVILFKYGFRKRNKEEKCENIKQCKWVEGDECYSLFYENNMLYKAIVISGDGSSLENKLMVQFVEFNIRQKTNTEDLYELSEIGEKSEIEIRNMYEVGKVCKVANISENEVQEVEIESIDWKKYKAENKNGEYVIFYPVYTLLCEDGQILENIEENRLMPENYSGTYEDFKKEKGHELQKFPKKPENFHFYFDNPNLHNEIRAKLDRINSAFQVPAAAGIGVDERLVQDAFFIAGFLSGYHEVVWAFFI